MKQVLLLSFVALSLFGIACKQDSNTASQAAPAPSTATSAPVDNTPKEMLVSGFENSGLPYPIVKEFTMPTLDACQGELEDFKRALTGAGMRWIKNPGKLDEWTEADQQKFSPEAAVLVPTKNGNYTAVFIEFAYHALNDINAYTVTIDKNGKAMDDERNYLVALCNEGEGNYIGAMTVDANAIKHVLKVEGGEDQVTNEPTK